MTIEMERDKLIRSIASARTALNTIALMLQGAVTIMMEEQVIDELVDWASIYNLKAASKEIMAHLTILMVLWKRLIESNESHR